MISWLKNFGRNGLTTEGVTQQRFFFVFFSLNHILDLSLSNSFRPDLVADVKPEGLWNSNSVATFLVAITKVVIV